jgi:DNA-binding transcriptional LysR family regulator
MDAIENMRAFVLSIEAGSFAAAARELGTSRALISKYVGQLEESLGVRLLHRTTRSITMTEAGEAYYSRAKDLVADFDELKALTSGQDYEPKGLLRVSVPESFGTRYIAPVLPEFLSIYPEIELDISFSDRICNVVDEGYDLAVRIGEEGKNNLVSRALTRVPYFLCASPEYIGSNGGVRTPEDLTEHQCIVDRSFPDGNKWRFKSDKKNFHVTVEGKILVNSSEAARAVALKGAGITLCPSYLVEKDIASGELVLLLDGWLDYDRTVYVLYPYARSISAKTRAFVNHMRKYFENRKFG